MLVFFKRSSLKKSREIRVQYPYALRFIFKNYLN